MGSVRRSTELMLYEGEAIAYFDDVAQAWCCGMCDVVLLADGECPRCDAVAVVPSVDVRIGFSA